MAEEQTDLSVDERLDAIKLEEDAVDEYESDSEKSGGILKRAVYFIGRIIVTFAIEFFWFFKSLIIVSIAITKAYWHAVNNVYETRKYTSTRILTLALKPFTVLVAMFPTAIIVSSIVGVFVFFDQALVYDEAVSADFINQVIDTSVTDGGANGGQGDAVAITSLVVGEKLHDGQKGALMIRASYHQLEKMLNRFPYWTVNDPWFYIKGLWDNSKNTQIGVWYASKEMARILASRITRYGTGDDQHPLALDGAQDLAVKPDIWKWEFAPSEEFYEDGIAKLKEFEKLAEADPSIVNIRADDLVFILLGIKDEVLGEAYGKLTRPSESVKWSEVDDIVKYARGVALVARDQLSVLRFKFTEEISRGGIDNLDIAISSLEGAIAFHPEWTEKGEGDSLIADHRAKLSRYYSEAIRRIEDLAESLKT